MFKNEQKGTEQNRPKEDEMDKIFTIPNILIYLVVINLFAFFLMWLDKRRAQKGEWRISENGLLMAGVLGGCPGAIAGMYKFRHKTKKPKFYIGLPTILVTQIVLVIYLVIKQPWM